MVSIEASANNTLLDVETSSLTFKATVVDKPFYDPKKKIASS